MSQKANTTPHTDLTVVSLQTTIDTSLLSSDISSLNSSPTTIQPSDSNNILTLDTTAPHNIPFEAIKHTNYSSDQPTINETAKHNNHETNNHLASINIITPAHSKEDSGARATISWKLGASDQSAGEENILPVEASSLDKVIIESSNTIGGSGLVITTQQQQNVASPGQVNRTQSKHSDSSATSTTVPSLIQISDKAFHSLPGQSIAQLALKSTLSSSSQSTSQAAAAAAAAAATTTTAVSNSNSATDSKRLRFKSLLDSVGPASASPAATSVTINTTTTTTTTCDSSLSELNSQPPTRSVTSTYVNKVVASSDRISSAAARCDSYEQPIVVGRNREEIPLDTLHEEDTQEEDEREEEEEEQHSDKSDEDEQSVQHQIGQFESYTKFNGRKSAGSSFRKSTTRNLLGGHTFIRIQRLLGVFNSKILGDNYKETPYVAYESKDLLTGDSKYPSPSAASGGRSNRKHHQGGKTFRGSYKYSRAEISMAICKKLINLLVQRSTLALIGAFLIHVTLGTVYTLSNINSYLTSYMRLHGSPTLTYGGSMWISSFYAVGQGFSMVLGGYLEKRFSARLACFLGCLIHSGSIMSTSWTVNHGSLAVLMSYGFLPGFGCGLAYMTPMSNGFGWFPNRRGLVAGVILAGFGIGTFVFNIAQTAYVNPLNLSPSQGSDGYFTQETILTKVPGLFLFIGIIYAAMQFVGCCLLFKPPQDHLAGKSPDERPILETEMSVSRAVRTREFVVLFLVYGIITQGVLFVNSMIKEYGQMFIGDDMYLAWTGSMASIANALGRLFWGLAIDRYTFTRCFTCITSIFGLLMFLMPFEFVLSSKQLYLVCTLGIFGSFSGWMSTFPVHLSRTFGRVNSGMLYGLIFISQSFGGIASAFGAHYLIDHYTRFVPFFCVVFLEILGLAIYHLFYPKQRALP